MWWDRVMIRLDAMYDPRKALRSKGGALWQKPGHTEVLTTFVIVPGLFTTYSRMEVLSGPLAAKISTRTEGRFSQRLEFIANSLIYAGTYTRPFCEIIGMVPDLYEGVPLAERVRVLKLRNNLRWFMERAKRSLREAIGR
jgi:hypothetical protein